MSEPRRVASPGVGVGMVALVAALGLVACPKRAPDSLPPCAKEGIDRRRASPLDRCLRLGDQHFEARDRPGELDRALAVYMDALLLAPTKVEVLARISRAYAVKGYAYPDENGEAWRLAMEYGQRCLRTAPDVLGAITASGGVLTARAIGSAEAPLAPCMLWTASAWARALQDRGVAGASIDLKPLTALARRTVELDADQEAGLPHAILGLALALPPAPLEPDLDQAARELQLAIAQAPWRLSAKVDLATLVYAAQGDHTKWTETLTAVVEAKPGAREVAENTAAQRRAREALEAGITAPSEWWR